MKRKTLHYQTISLERWCGRGLFYCIAALFAIFALRDIWTIIISDRVQPAQIVFDFGVISIAIWLVFSLAELDKLVLIKGRDKDSNKRIMYDVLSRMFKDTRFFFMNNELHGTRQRTRKHLAKDILVLFDGPDMLLNITRKIHFGEMDSPFHWFVNKAEVKDIQVEVEKILRSTKGGSA